MRKEFYCKIRHGIELLGLKRVKEFKFGFIQPAATASNSVEAGLAEVVRLTRC